MIYSLRKILSSLILAIFLLRVVIGESSLWAQTTSPGVQPSYMDSLPLPSQALKLSDKFVPLSFRGLEYDLQEPLKLSFYVETGNTKYNQNDFKVQTQKLVRYFLTALTTPTVDLWVNLSPSEKERIVPNLLGETELGRDLLAQDYILKQLASSLLSPEDKSGAHFWNILNSNTSSQNLTSLSRVWIVPDQAQIYRQGQRVIIANYRLKVLSESQVRQSSMVESTAEKTFREVIIPQVEREVNEGESFALLRQMYTAIILAEWYKKYLHHSILSESFNEKNKISGLQSEEKDLKLKIYERYVKAFHDGVINVTLESEDANENVVPRKYFSGGLKFSHFASSEILSEVHSPASIAPSQGDVFQTTELLLPSDTGVQVGFSPTLDWISAEESLNQNVASDLGTLSRGASSQVVQLSELPTHYYGRVMEIAKEMYKKVKGSLAEPNREYLRTVADQSFMKAALVAVGIDPEVYFNGQKKQSRYTPEQQAVLDRVYAIQQQLKSMKSGGRWYYADMGTILAAFIGEQTRDDGVNVFLPRDMGYGYTIQRALGDLGAVATDKGKMYYVSRASFGDENYDWFKSEAVTLAETAADAESFLGQLVENVRHKMEADSEFRVAIEKIKKDVEQLGLSQHQKLRFIDSSTGRFPILMQVVFKIYFPKIKTSGLVINSFSEKVLSQMDPATWQQEIKSEIEKDSGLAKLLNPKDFAGDLEKTPEGSQEARRSFFHPVRFDKTDQQLHTSPIHEMLMSDWISLAFLMGTARYYLMLAQFRDLMLLEGMESSLIDDVGKRFIPQVILEPVAAQQDVSGMTTTSIEPRAEKLSQKEVDLQLNQIYVGLGGKKKREFFVTGELYDFLTGAFSVNVGSPKWLSALKIGMGVVLVVGAIYMNSHRKIDSPVSQSAPTKEMIDKEIKAINELELGKPFQHQEILSLGSKGPAFEEFKARMFASVSDEELLKWIKDLPHKTNSITHRRYSKDIADNAVKILKSAHAAEEFTRHFETVVIALQSTGRYVALYGLKTDEDGDVGPFTRELVQKIELNSHQSSDHPMQIYTPKSGSSAVGGITFAQSVPWVIESGGGLEKIIGPIDEHFSQKNISGITPVLISVQPVDFQSLILEDFKGADRAN